MSNRYTWERLKSLSHFKNEYNNNKEYIIDIDPYVLESINRWLYNNDKLLQKQNQIHLCRIWLFATKDEVDNCLKTIFTPYTTKGEKNRTKFAIRYGKRYSIIRCNKNSKNMSILRKEWNKLNPDRSNCFKPKQWYIDNNQMDKYNEMRANNRASAVSGDAWKNVLRDHRSVDYWKIKHGLDQESAEIEVKKYIERHGKASVIGMKKSFERKHGDSWESVYKEFKKDQGKYYLKNPRTRTSNKSIEACKIISENLKDIISEIKQEWYITIPAQTIKFYDAKIIFVCGTEVLLEYDGTAWHVVPGYESHYIGYKYGRSPESVISNDKLKEVIARSKGFDIIRIHSEMSEIEYCERIRRWYDSARL